MLDSPRAVLARGLSLSRTPQAGTSAWIRVKDRFPLVLLPLRARSSRSSRSSKYSQERTAECLNSRTAFRQRVRRYITPV